MDNFQNTISLKNKIILRKFRNFQIKNFHKLLVDWLKFNFILMKKGLNQLSEWAIFNWHSVLIKKCENYREKNQIIF
jgi:hypothetical protein